MSSHGQAAYVYLPDTWRCGFTSFNHYFFCSDRPQSRRYRRALEPGGDIADHVIDAFRRTPMRNYESRQGLQNRRGPSSIRKPCSSTKAQVLTVMRCVAVSSGHARAACRHPDLGAHVGIGVSGTVRRWQCHSPADCALWFTLSLRWRTSGWLQTLRSKMIQRAVRDGHDPQLARTVQYVMEELRKDPLSSFPIPAYPIITSTTAWVAGRALPVSSTDGGRIDNLRRSLLALAL